MHDLDLPTYLMRAWPIISTRTRRYVKQQPDASGTDPVFNPDTAMKLQLYGLFKQAKGNEYGLFPYNP